MIRLKAKDGYTLVNKDKSFIYGIALTAPDTFDKDSVIEIPDSEIEEIQKQIDLKMQEEMKKYEMEV